MNLIKTARLRLRKINLLDADFILRLVSEPAFIENIGNKGIETLQDARRFIREGPWTNQEKPGYGQFLVELIENTEPIGICGLLYRKELDLTDIGFAVLEKYRGKGLAYEAAAATMAYGHKQLGVEVIHGLTSERNQASIRLLEKLGLYFDKIIKTADDDPGTVIYSEKITRRQH